MVRGDVLTQGTIVLVHRGVEFSSLILSSAWSFQGKGSRRVVLGFFFPSLLGLEECCICQPSPMVLRDQCSSCSFSSGGNAAGREGWQFDGSVCWFLHGIFRAACPPSGQACVSQPCEAQMVRQQRTPLGLDIISSSAKVTSLILTASNLSLLPWASCKTEEVLLFSRVWSVTGSSPEVTPGLVAQTA